MNSLLGDVFRAVVGMSLFVAASTIIIAPVVVLAFWIDSASCASRAERMGMAHSWGPLQGCMIEYKPKQWINIDKYRAVNLP